ncbi:hypothetical protein D910_11893 [Dendroctonus ponderosae]|uniref:Serine/threonine-protein kinase ATR n=1 Tax=Dendroctonus ponderosae TaxID=77166 RepID=U4UWE8_DENPD|nr:hypothetical protein D910_11893 [Dendroctonus ponderosae]
MESPVLQDVFPTWKMVDELVDTLLKTGATDKNSIQTLANMAMSEQFSRTFIYNKEADLSFQEYQAIVDKYQTFTTWLLGQFFYLLSRDNNEIIVDAQLSIINQLSRTQLHVYAYLADEYCRALNILCGYLKDCSKPRRIDVFEPKRNEELSKSLNLKSATIELTSEKTCLQLIKKLLKIVKYVLIESFTFNCLDQATVTALDNILFLLRNEHWNLDVIAVFIDLLGRLNYNIKVLDLQIVQLFKAFFSLFEQYVYDFYGNGNKSKVDKDAFEDLLFRYLEECRSLKADIHQNDARIASFLIKLSLESRPGPAELTPGKEIQIASAKYFSQTVSSMASLAMANISTVITRNDSVIFSLLEPQIFKETCSYMTSHSHATVVEVMEISETWKQICFALNSSWLSLQCSPSICQMQSRLEFFVDICASLARLKFRIYSHYNSNEYIVNFFSGSVILPKVLSNIAKHSISCHRLIKPLKVLEFLVKHLGVTECKNLDIFFHLISCRILPGPGYATGALPNNYQGPIEERSKLKADINCLYDFIRGNKHISNVDVLANTTAFFDILSSGLVKNLNDSHMEQIEAVHLNVLKNLRNSEDTQVLSQVLESIPVLLNVFSAKDDIVKNILLPLLPTKHNSVQQTVAKIIPLLLCCSLSDFVKVVTNDSIQIICQECATDSKNAASRTGVYRIKFSRNGADISSVAVTLLKTVINYLINPSEDLKKRAIQCMPSLAQHVPKFFTVDVTKIWIEKVGDSSVEVRKVLGKDVRRIIANGLGNPAISKEIKDKVLEMMFSVLLRLSKRSLQFSEFELQDTLLDTISEISRIEHESIKLQCMKILLYFVMVPTSFQSFIAVNRCVGLSKNDSAGHLLVYKHHSDTLCEVIVHLCYSNQYIIKASLQESLVKVSAMLGFDGVKDFVAKEVNKLLPFLVAKTVKNNNVRKLIEEMASIISVDVSDMLITNYGHIFLYLFLGDVDRADSKKCLNYLEATTKLSGPKLRKLNFKVLLNELLLNFHEKRQKVLTTFQLLLAEDNLSQGKSIEDYLEPYFLAFLLYFNLELTSEYSKKEKMLLSLADLLKFLGPNRIMPLRFKILAMLQATHYLKHPALTCIVWEAFIRSCEPDYLGPHLATIFASMLPLIEKCPNDVNKIFRYLILENEATLRDYIADLFFVNNHFLSPNISIVIRKHVKTTEKLALKAKIQRYLKYLKHDSLEVRVQSLRQLKSCLEQNREELDQMVLGYNGIDSTIVELIDYLTLACRTKEVALKLACGDIFGELGAIEPSHLPRRCAQDSQSFNFFISDDAFIESAINELIKSFQTDKNARNTDRVALAIQEILKTYEISPNPDSARNDMWTRFPEAHREVMTPLLSSKYICVEKFVGYPCPVYGSGDGSSFQAWLYNWTSSLISTLSPEKRSLLQSCFPSMKLDQRVLMHFLPYIVLHSLVDSVNSNEEKCYVEFEFILNGFNKLRDVDEKILSNRPLPVPGQTPIARELTGDSEKQIKCAKVVFILLDFLDRWLREWQWLNGLSAETDRNYQSVKRQYRSLVAEFLAKFCKLQVAKCNYKCGEYSRALMYLEDYITESPDQVLPNLQFLGEIYAQLDEPDGVLGVEPLQQSEPSLEQKLLSLKVSGKLNDAAAIYEHMPRPLKLQHVQNLIQCYLDLDKVNTALYCAEGALGLQPEFGNMLLDMQAEALWRLGTYENLDRLLANPDVDNCKGWGVQVGKSLLCIKNEERDEFKRVLESIKKQQVDSFGAASLEEGAYHHGYSYIAHLHCLNELEQLEQKLVDLFLKPNDRNYAESIVQKLANEWQLRIKVVQESVRVVEPLLCLRRVALNLARDIAERKAPQAVPHLENLLGETWLKSVNVARRAGMHQQAYTYVLDAEKYNPPKLFIEKAKLHWLREEHEEALNTLKRGLHCYIPDGSSNEEALQAIANLSVEQKKLCAEARLLIASYNKDICSVDVETNLQQYKDAVEVCKEWEKSLVCLAQYQDRIFQNYNNEEKDSKANELQLHIVHNFGKSLYFGTTYIYQSMPRLLSIWFDCGTRLSNVASSAPKEERRLVLVKMTKIIDSFLNKLPAFVFLTSFSQIISRIAHPQKEVYVQLKSIIVNLMLHYPQQCLWMISSVIKSSYPIRAKRCAEILNDPLLKMQPISRIIRDFSSLTEKLIELCNKEISSDVHNASVNLLVRSLPRLLNKDFSEIMMPTHKFRKLILPNPDIKNAQSHHNPFPNHYVHIVGIDDNISILQSLQRPRKISLKGSNGKSYTFMLKPKDDLRKDFRLMEFNDIVNHLLLRDAEARQRRLNIRLYSVAPLNEECGLIEWVHDLVGLRHILMNIYKQRGLGMRPREIKEVCCSIRDSIGKKRNVFQNILVKRHPPVLGEWFRKTFPDAQTWLTARTAYTRTNAVISITGYMLGLGDRHGENILLDATCGDVVHVDFNCLFNKGETFEWPERVPFRLTQNMIAAMGPLGVEGVFRQASEFTLGVLRSNTSTLMSIVTPFVYDPLVSWPRNVPAAAQSSEKVNEQALEHIKNIELRLQGKVKTRSRTMSQCLSIEGQIEHLINEAKSSDNLCQMYIGWGPYL